MQILPQALIIVTRSKIGPHRACGVLEKWVQSHKFHRRIWLLSFDPIYLHLKHENATGISRSIYHLSIRCKRLNVQIFPLSMACPSEESNYEVHLNEETIILIYLFIRLKKMFLLKPTDCASVVLAGSVRLTFCRIVL